jgi:hypothetical protein
MAADYRIFFPDTGPESFSICIISSVEFLLLVFVSVFVSIIFCQLEVTTYHTLRETDH